MSAVGTYSNFSWNKIILARYFKGATSISEMNDLPVYELQMLNYICTKEKEEEAKLSDKEKGARQFGRMIEDNLS